MQDKRARSRFVLFDLPGALSQQLYRHLRGRWPAWFTSREGVRMLAVSLDQFDVDLEMLLETVADWAGEAGLRAIPFELDGEKFMLVATRSRRSNG
jgi:hypothetical protein